MNEKSERRPRIVRVERVLGAVGIALLLAGAYTWSWHAATGPHVPVVTEGRVYELNNHGTLAYLTRGEWYRLYGLFIAAIAFIGAAMWVHVKFVDRN